MRSDVHAAAVAAVQRDEWPVAPPPRESSTGYRFINYGSLEGTGVPFILFTLL